MSDAQLARGDRRRTALLEALDHHLRESSLDSINIADISRRAGVTRSAFYFYFDNKASAVAALMEEMYDESMVAADLLRGEGTPAERVEGMVRGLFTAWERHEHIYRAMYDARATSTTVRELWDNDRESFVPVIAAGDRGRARRRHRAGGSRRHASRLRPARAERPDARAARARRAARP